MHLRQHAHSGNRPARAPPLEDPGGPEIDQTSRNRRSAMLEPARPTKAPTPTSTTVTESISEPENVKTFSRNGIALPTWENSSQFATSTMPIETIAPTSAAKSPS